MPPKGKTTASKRTTAPRAVASDDYQPTTWGATPATSGIGVAEDVVVPSGQRALVRRPGVQGLVAAGILDHVDSLTAIVGEKHINRAKGKAPEVNMKSLAKDPKQLSQALDLIDKVVCHIVLKPSLQMSPKCLVCNNNQEWHAWEDADKVDHSPVIEREDGVLYVGDVDLEDKMFLLNFAVGGTRDLESFRKQSSELLDGVDFE